MTDLNWNDLWDEAEQRYRVETRNGRPVRIFTISHQGNEPIVGEACEEGRWGLYTWFANGRYFLVEDRESHLDLVPEPRTVRRWANVYRRANGTYYIADVADLYESEAAARASARAAGKHIATVPVEWEENP